MQFSGVKFQRTTFLPNNLLVDLSLLMFSWQLTNTHHHSLHSPHCLCIGSASIIWTWSRDCFARFFLFISKVSCTFPPVYDETKTRQLHNSCPLARSIRFQLQEKGMVSKLIFVGSKKPSQFVKMSSVKIFAALGSMRFINKKNCFASSIFYCTAAHKKHRKVDSTLCASFILHLPRKLTFDQWLARQFSTCNFVRRFPQ